MSALSQTRHERLTGYRKLSIWACITSKRSSLPGAHQQSGRAVDTAVVPSVDKGHVSCRLWRGHPAGEGLLDRSRPQRGGTAVTCVFHSYPNLFRACSTPFVELLTRSTLAEWSGCRYRCRMIPQWAGTCSMSAQASALPPERGFLIEAGRREVGLLSQKKIGDSGVGSQCIGFLGFVCDGTDCCEVM